MLLSWDLNSSTRLALAALAIAEGPFVDGDHLAGQKRFAQVLYSSPSCDSLFALKNSLKCRSESLRIVTLAKHASLNIFNPLSHIANVGRYHRQVASQGFFHHVRRSSM